MTHGFNIMSRRADEKCAIVARMIVVSKTWGAIVFDASDFEALGMEFVNVLVVCREMSQLELCNYCQDSVRIAAHGLGERRWTHFWRTALYGSAGRWCRLELG